jgi:glycosyltransferase involved in cell wall biosynthesis
MVSTHSRPGYRETSSSLALHGEPEDQAIDTQFSPLVMFCYFFTPENVTGVSRPTRFVKYLPLNGFQPLIITKSQQLEPSSNVHCVPDTVRADIDTTGRHKSAAAYFELIARRVFLGGEDGLAWSRKASAKAHELLSSDAVPLVYSTSPPLSAHFAALQLKMKRRIRWVADFRDPLWGNPFRSKAPINVDAVLEKLIFDKADLVIANTDTVADMWRARHPQHEHKIRLIWNGFDSECMLKPAAIPQRPFRMLVHAGSLYGGRNPALLLRSVSRLIERQVLDPATFRIVLVGPVAGGEFIRADKVVADRLASLGVLDLRPVMIPRGEAYRLMAEADGQLLIDLNGYGAALQVPAKLFEYMQFGRPVLALTTRKSPSDRILAQSGLEYRSLYLDDREEMVDRKVMQFLNIPTTAVFPRPEVLSQFDACNQVRRLCQDLQRLERPFDSPARRSAASQSL